MSDDWTDLLTSMEETIEDSGRGYQVSRFSLGGEKHLNGLVDAVMDNYDHTGRPPVTQEQMDALVGQKVTILTRSNGSFGHRSIQALSGTVFQGNSGPGILPKGKRKNGYSLQGLYDAYRLLDIEPGYNNEGFFAEKIAALRAQFPTVEPLTQDDLTALPRRSKTCSLAVFGTYPFLGDPAVGTIWLIHSYMKSEDIVENVCFINPSMGTSEHGSCYGKDLLAMNVGKVVGFDGMSFQDAINLTMDRAGEMAIWHRLTKQLAA